VFATALARRHRHRRQLPPDRLPPAVAYADVQSRMS